MLHIQNLLVLIHHFDPGECYQILYLYGLYASDGGIRVLLMSQILYNELYSL